MAVRPGAPRHAGRDRQRLNVRLAGHVVVLRPLELGDVGRMIKIQSDPSVARWWGEPDRDKLERKARGEDDTTVFAIEAERELVGLIQYYENDDADYRHAGIDLFLASSAQGLGLGSDAIRTLAHHLIDERGHHRIVIDPAADNAAAIRAYEKVGFKRVGLMRRYWRDRDEVWRDGVLMDLLTEELDS